MKTGVTRTQRRVPGEEGMSVGQSCSGPAAAQCEPAHTPGTGQRVLLGTTDSLERRLSDTGEVQVGGFSKHLQVVRHLVNTYR